MLLVLLFKFWPLVAGAIIGVRTLFGRPTVLGSIAGAASFAVVAIFVLSFLEPASPWYLPAAGLGLLAIGAHIVRLAIHLFGRATGGRPKETIRKWWR